ncbi:hypothetical protein Pint_20078 [Pistacia integerrima]|uniref:Uncharacterized protein n=1 Tax=Pistacia integerrima TaxID=434235 RepID=A0ACC0XDT8_9ROSI|nr:hypothetical protein Pint_20078 [Pistacia integerrima]
MMASSLSLKPFFTSLFTDLNHQGSALGNFPTSLGIKKEFNFMENQLFVKKFSLNCSMDRDMDVSTSAVVDDLAECCNEMSVKEPSVLTLLMNFESKFDPYDAMSIPLYQTATFKQPSATENGPYDYTRSGNPTRDALESLLAKLDKADRAFCFTSGMAALAAVSHLVENGEEIVAGDDLYGGSDRLLSRVTPKAGIVVKLVYFLF